MSEKSNYKQIAKVNQENIKSSCMSRKCALTNDKFFEKLCANKSCEKSSYKQSYSS